MASVVVREDTKLNNDGEFLQIVSVTGRVIIDCASHVSRVIYLSNMSKSTCSDFPFFSSSN